MNRLWMVVIVSSVWNLIGFVFGYFIGWRERGVRNS